MFLAIASRKNRTRYNTVMETTNHVQHLGILGIALFATTNIDDVFVLLGFFSDPGYKARQVVIGQFAGIIALIVISVIGALVAGLIPTAYIGFLGLFPLAIGVRKLFALRKLPTDEEEVPKKDLGDSNILSVAAVTVANGDNNIGVYIPVFAKRPHLEVAELCAVFLVMTAVWCAVAHSLVNRKAVGTVLRKYGRFLLPCVYIGLGAYILIKSNPFAAVLHHAHP